MVKIKKFCKVSYFAPTQWVGITDENQQVYIRYRHGNLEVIIGKPPVKNHPESDIIVDKNVESDNHGGKMKSRRLVNELDDTEINIDHESEKPKYEEELRAVLDNMSEYIRNIDVDQ